MILIHWKSGERIPHSGNNDQSLLNASYHIGKLLYPNFTWRIETEEPKVYLTFDDGPHPVATHWVLDILSEYDFKASFFVVGQNAKKYPDIIERLAAEGHSIGNHTHNHLKGWSVESDEYLEDIKECFNYIPETTLFRPPYGRINRNSIPELSQYRVVMWDNLSMDYKLGVNIERRLKVMEAQTEPGSIIVFHDSQKALSNLKEMLPRYLEYLKTNGFNSIAL